MNGKSKFIVYGLVGALIVGAGTYKRVSEERRPFGDYTSAQCADKIKSARTIEFREIPFKWGKTYNILVNNERLGTVVEKPLSFGLRFDFYAGPLKEAVYLGHAEEQVLSLGHKSTVYDENQHLVGRLEERILSLGTKIEVFDSEGNKIAISKEKLLSNGGRKILDSNGSLEIGNSEKTFLWDNYTMKVPSGMDRRLALSLIAMENKIDDNKSKSDDD